MQPTLQQILQQGKQQQLLQRLGDLRVFVEAFLIDKLTKLEISLITKIQTELTNAVTEAVYETGRLRETIKDGAPGYTPIKGKDYVDGKTPTKQELLTLIKPLIPLPEKGEPGSSPTKKQLTTLIRSLIPEPKNGTDPRPEDVVPLVLQQLPKIDLEQHSKMLSEQIDERITKQITKTTEQLYKEFTKQIKDLKQLLRHGGGGGGGMGNWKHEVFNTSSVTTSVTLADDVAAGGSAILVRYQGQLLAHGVQYTISGRVVTLTFTLNDSTFVEVTYVRT